MRRLQADGRVPVTQLAREAHLSVTPCTDRVRHLEEQGFISGYHAHLDPALLGQSLLAYIQVHLDRTTPDGFERFKNAMMVCDEVMECQMVAGGFDYLLKVRVRDINAYRQFLGETLANIRGLLKTHTYFVMEEVKSSHEVVINDY